MDPARKAGRNKPSDVNMVGIADEAYLHGREVDIENLRKQISKALISTLRMANILGMTEKDLVHALEKKYDAKI